MVAYAKWILLNFYNLHRQRVMKIVRISIQLDWISNRYFISNTAGNKLHSDYAAAIPSSLTNKSARDQKNERTRTFNFPPIKCIKTAFIAIESDRRTCLSLVYFGFNVGIAGFHALAVTSRWESDRKRQVKKSFFGAVFSPTKKKKFKEIIKGKNSSRRWTRFQLS